MIIFYIFSNGPYLCWMKQVDHHKNDYSNSILLLIYIELEPNILYKEFLGENNYPVPVLELYSSFEEYEQITLPWLFEETFEEVI